jgi:hypothetical protein
MYSGMEYGGKRHKKAPAEVISSEGASRKFITTDTLLPKIIPNITSAKQTTKPISVAISTTYTHVFCQNH